MPSPPDRSREINAAAAQWLAKRDRGLSPAEQDAYLQWLREAPEHGPAITNAERCWKRLSGLQTEEATYRAELATPGPSAPARHKLVRWTLPMAAAAAVVLAGIVWWSGQSATGHARPEWLTLDDGSVVTVNAGARVDVRFSDTMRRVSLLEGEAFFAVARDPARPFIVEADELAIRAVGTAFAVQRAPVDVSVLVTEGTVRVALASSDELASVVVGGEPLAQLVPGKHAVVRQQAGREPQVVVRDVTQDEIEQALQWKGVTLEFDDVPLSQVVIEFNRYNPRKLVLASVDTGEILIGGSFRADNVEAFVRLLESGFNVGAESQGGQIVLRRRK